MAKDPYEKMVDEYCEKVEEKLREGGVGAASAARAVKDWKHNCRAGWAAGRTPAYTAKDIAFYESLPYQPPKAKPKRAARRRRA